MQAISDAKISVRLAEIFRPETILVGLKNHTRRGAVAELVGQLVRSGCIAERAEQTIVESILARENLRGAALYDGVAFPHCRLSLTDRFVGVLGIEPDGILFDAENDRVVHGVFLFLAPLDHREELYDVLGRIAAIGRDKSRCAQLRGCRTAEAAYRFLQNSDR